MSVGPNISDDKYGHGVLVLQVTCSTLLALHGKWHAWGPDSKAFGMKLPQGEGRTRKALCGTPAVCLGG
jgi:hypothetical protein